MTGIEGHVRRHSADFPEFLQRERACAGCRIAHVISALDEELFWSLYHNQKI